MIEGINEAQPLIEELLRLPVLGRYGVMEVSEAGDKNDWMRRSVVGVLLSGGAQAYKNSTENTCQSLHLVDPPRIDFWKGTWIARTQESSMRLQRLPSE